MLQAQGLDGGKINDGAIYEFGLQDFVDVLNILILAPMSIKPADCKYIIERVSRKASAPGTVALDEERALILCEIK
ncbi:MAG: hypothetical protein EZS28_055506 [Streblomastix strix]|uniref:Uncharacterized protein n=1 Tax=Streblomastix strix TaxID=222440 RepID=A0A5J4Q0D2_9EUKA|nr:MAG: hypothetical protein EZS28_055506 [Streblomastix strix]